MALVKTGTFTARMEVKSPEIQYVPATGTAVANPTPFILTNVGRSNGANTDLIIINNIAVEPSDAHESATNPAIGSIASYLCTVTNPAVTDTLIPIIPMDSVNVVPTGLSAHGGQIGWTDNGTVCSNIVMSPSPFSAAGASVAHLYGPMGATRKSPMIVNTEPLGVPTGQAFQIRKPDHGATDSTVFVTVMLRTLTGHTFLVEGGSGSGSDIITIYNNTGSRVLVIDVQVVDAYRVTSVNQRYDVIIATANLRVDTPAQIAAFDSAKPIPSWVRCGKGFYVREGADMWVDYTEVLDVQIPVSSNIWPGASAPRSNRPFNSGRPTSKYLRPGKSLVFQIAAATAMHQGEHDIIVTFTTYSEEVTAGSGGEYSYAY